MEYRNWLGLSSWVPNNYPEIWIAFLRFWILGLCLKELGAWLLGLLKRSFRTCNVREVWLYSSCRRAWQPSCISLVKWDSDSSLQVHVPRNFQPNLSWNQSLRKQNILYKIEVPPILLLMNRLVRAVKTQHQTTLQVKL